MYSRKVPEPPLATPSGAPTADIATVDACISPVGILGRPGKRAGHPRNPFCDHVGLSWAPFGTVLESLWDLLSIATVREEERTGEGQITEETTREGKGGDDLRRAEESNEHGVRSVLVHPKGGSWQQASLELDAVDGADAYFDVMPTHAHSRTHVETHEGQK